MEHVRNFTIAPRRSSAWVPPSRALLAVIVMSSCRPADKPPERPTAHFTTKDSSVAIAIIADSHFTNLTGYRKLDSMSCTADKHVPSAIRPPLLDLWAPNVLRFVLQDLGAGSNAHPDILVHLGDAATISCTGEFDRFATILNARLAHHWFMAPGNHDSFMMGNFALGPSDLCATRPNDRACRRTWAAACSDGTEGRREMFKAEFLKRYLVALGFPAGEIRESADFSKEGLTAFGPLERVFLGNREIPGERINNAPHGHHFLLQQIALSPKVAGIIIDSSDFVGNPFHARGVATAGSRGAISREQIEVLARWVHEIKNRDIVFFGHLPFSNINGQFSALAGLLAQPNVIGYVSAHTHTAARYCDGKHGQDGPDFRELNVGSILDWPMEYGLLELTPGARGAGMRYQRHTVGERLNSTVCSKWSPWDREAYVGYCPAKDSESTYRQMMNRGLDEWFKVSSQKAPSIATTSDRERNLALIRAAEANGSLDQDFAVCQARWASEAEALMSNGKPSHFDRPTCPRGNLETLVPLATEQK